MNSGTIEDIYNKFISEPEYTLDYALRFFNEYAVPFYRHKTFENGDELNIYIKFTWHYLHALFQKNMFVDTSDKSQNILTIIDSEAERLNLNITGNEWYLGIILFKGMATYKLRKYKLATHIFRQLTDLDTQNDNYKNWLKYSKYQEQKWISKTSTIACVILFLGGKIFAKYMSFSLSMSILVIAIAGLSSSLFYDFYSKKIFKKA
jgi:hypothetical protein